MVIRDDGRGPKELKETDRKKTVSLLGRWNVTLWKGILQKMPFLGYKAEIEVLGEELEE